MAGGEGGSKEMKMSRDRVWLGWADGGGGGGGTMELNPLTQILSDQPETIIYGQTPKIIVIAPTSLSYPNRNIKYRS